jgi:hypothetical protein
MVWTYDVGIPIYLAFILGYKIIRKSKRVVPASADLITGKARIGIQNPFKADNARSR